MAKRPADEEISMQTCRRMKLASPGQSSGSDTESIHSYQSYETELVRDTSDTSSPPTLTQDNIEYEVTDTEEQKVNFFYSDDSDDQDDVELDAVFTLSTCESLDNALLGDTSEENSTSPTSNSDVDPGLPRNDYLDFEKCLLCQTDKKDISYPYCSTCFTWKKNLFPSRPKKRQRGLRKDGSQADKESDDPSSQNSKTDNVADNLVNEKDAAQGEGSLSDGLFEDSGVGSSQNQLSQDTVDGPSQPSTSSSTSNTSTPNQLSIEMCRVCFLKPENGLFLHSTLAHRYGCYTCAKKIWYHSGGCPICRRKVGKVAKLYI